MANIGGFSVPRPATANDHEILDSVKEAVEKKLRRRFHKFLPILVANQVVEGVNYLMKVDVGLGDDEYLHARINEDLKDVVTLAAFEFPKKEDDPLVYFEE